MIKKINTFIFKYFTQYIHRFLAIFLFFRITPLIYDKIKKIAVYRKMNPLDWMLVTLNYAAEREITSNDRFLASKRILKKAYETAEDEDIDEMNSPLNTFQGYGINSPGAEMYRIPREESDEPQKYVTPQKHSCIFFSDKIPFGSADKSVKGTCLHQMQYGIACRFAPENVKECVVAVRDKSIHP